MNKIWRFVAPRSRLFDKVEKAGTNISLEMSLEIRRCLPARNYRLDST